RLVKPRDHGLRREHAHPSRGKLDGEGQRVEVTAQLGNGDAAVVVDGELWSHLARSLLEQPHGWGYVSTGLEGMRQRRNGDLSLAADVQRFAARGEDLQVRTGREQLGDVGASLEDLLEIVEDEEAVSGPQEPEQQLLVVSPGRRRR